MLGFGKKLNAYTDTNKGIYKIKMFRKIGGKYVCIDTVKIKVDDTKFRYKGKDFSLFLKDRIGWADSKANYYAFDFDKEKQLTLTDMTLVTDKVSLEDLDIYVNKGLIAQLVAGLEKAKSEKYQWILALVIGVMAGIMGFFIGQYVANQPAEEAAKMALMLVH